MGTFGRLSGFSLLGIAILALGCGKKDSQQKPGENAGTALNIVDGFEVNCLRTRGPDLRRQIVYGPRIQCNNTVPDCPAGSFCSPGPASVCTLECDPDNRCQDGYYCSCDGMCIALGSVSDGGVPPNSACPADAALLQSPLTKLRACQWDDECPYGSRCDRGLGTCTWNCLDGVQPCAVGQVCNCLGQCIPAAQDGGIPQPASYAPRLGATPLDGLLILNDRSRSPDSLIRIGPELQYPCV